MAGMTLQALEGHPGLEADVFVSRSPQRDEEDNNSGRNVSGFEHLQDLETPSLPPLWPMAPWDYQVCLCSWAEGFQHLRFYPHFPNSE